MSGCIHYDDQLRFRSYHTLRALHLRCSKTHKSLFLESEFYVIIISLMFCTLIFSLCIRLQDLSPFRAMIKIVKEPPPTFSDPHVWSDECFSFVDAAVQKDPALRYIHEVFV